jgi:hypothetical protein
VKDRRQLGNDDPFYPIAEIGHVEIDEKADFEAGETQDIGHMLLCRGAKVWLGGGDDDTVLDQKIHAHGTVHPVAFISDGQGMIALEHNLAHAQLQAKAIAVGFRSQTWAKMPMDFHAGSDDEMWEFLGIEFHDEWDTQVGRMFKIKHIFAKKGKFFFK